MKKSACFKCLTLAAGKSKRKIECCMLYDLLRASINEWDTTLDTEELSDMISEVLPNANDITTHNTGMPRLTFRGIQK